VLPGPGHELDQIRTVTLTQLGVALGERCAEGVQRRAGASEEGGERSSVRPEFTEQGGDGLEVGLGGRGRDELAVGVDGLQEGLGLAVEEVHVAGEAFRLRGRGVCALVGLDRGRPWAGAVA